MWLLPPIVTYYQWWGTLMWNMVVTVLRNTIIAHKYVDFCVYTNSLSIAVVWFSVSTDPTLLVGFKPSVNRSILCGQQTSFGNSVWISQKCTLHFFSSSSCKKHEWFGAWPALQKLQTPQPTPASSLFKTFVFHLWLPLCLKTERKSFAGNPDFFEQRQSSSHAAQNYGWVAS